MNNRVYIKFNDDDMIKFSCVQHVMSSLHHSAELPDHLRRCLELPKRVAAETAKNDFEAGGELQCPIRPK